MVTPRPVRRREVRLNPGLQAQLLQQMREEQAASANARRFRLFVLLPALLVATGVSLKMALSDDPTINVIGNLVASSLLWLFWKLRRRIGSALGLGQ